MNEMQAIYVVGDRENRWKAFFLQDFDEFFSFIQIFLYKLNCAVLILLVVIYSFSNTWFTF